MRTRTLTTLSVTLLTAGLSTGAAATLHLAGDGPAAMRITVLLCITAGFPWHAAQSRRTAGIGADQLAAARVEGYRTGLMHAALGVLDGPDGGTRACTNTPAAYARGHLHAVPTDQERKAE